jgi:ABC-2 type transport system ATP-binding protein
MPLAMPPVLEVRDLVKQYPGVRAVDGVSFAIPEGQCFGLLGPNGAGKTTTVEMMEGVTTPTAGEVLYRGERLGSRFRAEAGIQFQKTALQDFLTVRETLTLFTRLYPRRRPVDELIRTCALEQVAERDNRKLSGGQMQRLLLGIALANDPRVLFLDEPTTGLDPQARHNFWDLIRAIKAEGRTVLLTTHYMEEAYFLCDVIAIMDRGRIIAEGPPSPAAGALRRRRARAAPRRFPRRTGVLSVARPHDAGSRRDLDRRRRGLAARLAGTRGAIASPQDPAAQPRGPLPRADRPRAAHVSFGRLLAVWHARNLEFLRDRSTLIFNFLFPLALVIAFAVIFGGQPRALFKVDVVAPPDAALDAALHPFLATRYVDFVRITPDEIPATVRKVERHQVDLLLDLRAAPRYWINEDSPKGYLAETLLREAAAAGATR